MRNPRDSDPILEHQSTGRTAVRLMLQTIDKLTIHELNQIIRILLRAKQRVENQKPAWMAFATLEDRDL